VEASKSGTKEFLGKRWLEVNEVVAFRKLVTCSRITGVRQLGIFLYMIRCKRQHHTEQSGAEEEAL
jgi:hypothetical protein